MAKEASDEVTERQMKLASNEGTAYHESLEYMIEDVAHTGGMQEVQDRVIGIAQEQAEGMYMMQNGKLAWEEPTGEANCHIEVAVMDADDHRFIPYCDVQITVFDEDDTEYGPFDLPFIWHPGLYHYGANIALPGDGTYDIRVHVDPPDFPRHDLLNGERYTTPVEVVFENMDILTGREE